MIAKYHTSITHDALESYFSNPILNLISEANVDSDTLFEEKEGVSDNYNVTAQHFNNTSLEECEDFLKQAEEVAIDSLVEAVRTTDGADVSENYTEAFYNVGRLMHCIQDFYSHTNWINQTGDEVVVWNEDIENQISSIRRFQTAITPNGLILGQSKYVFEKQTEKR
jgi:hypothetical protein